LIFRTPRNVVVGFVFICEILNSLNRNMLFKFLARFLFRVAAALWLMGCPLIAGVQSADAKKVLVVTVT